MECNSLASPVSSLGPCAKFWPCYGAVTWHLRNGTRLLHTSIHLLEEGGTWPTHQESRPDCEGRGPEWFHFWREAGTKKRKETDPPGNRLTFSKDHPRGLNCGHPGETRKLSPIQLLTLKLRSWILIKNSSLKNINCLLFRVLSEAVPQGLRMNCYYFRVVGAEVEVGKRSQWELLTLP